MFYDTVFIFKNIEDLTRVVISYEIYETNLFNDHESKIPFIIWPFITYFFITFKMHKLDQYENALLTRMLSMTLRIRAKVLLHVWSYDFYDMTLPTEYQRRHMINSYMKKGQFQRNLLFSDIKHFSPRL